MTESGRLSALYALLFLLYRKGAVTHDEIYKALGISPTRAKMLLRADKRIHVDEIIHYTASLILHGPIEVQNGEKTQKPKG